MNEKYIVLLSSLIACTSMGMDNKALKGADYWESLDGTGLYWRYASVHTAHIHKIGAAEKEIENNIATLRENKQLTEDAVLTIIKNAFNNHAVDQEGEREFKHVYMNNEDIVSAMCIYYNRVHKYHGMGSRVALLFRDDSNVPLYTYVCEEKSRGTWEHIKHVTMADNVKNIYLINDGKTLAIRDDNGGVKFEDIDAEKDNLNNEILIKEFEEKHAENYPNGPDGKEQYKMEHDTGMSCRGLNINTPGRYIMIQTNGLRVEYEPTLQEIAKYIVSKAQQTGSQN